MESTELNDGYFQSIGFDAPSRQLHVRLTNGNYVIYSEVTQMDYIGLISSNQKQDFFEEKITKRFPSRQIND